MNILLITTLYPAYEGQPRIEVSYALHQFVQEWRSKGHNVKVIRLWSKFPYIFTLMNKGKLNKKYRKDKNVIVDDVDVKIITINRLPKIDYFMFQKERALKKIINGIGTTTQPDVIVCHMMNPSLYISKKLKELWNVPLVFTVHQTDIKQLRSNQRRYNEYLELIPYIDRLGFRSNALMRQYAQLNLPNNNNFIVNSGIDESLIIGEDVIEQKINSNEKVIFVASSMIPRKNIDVLIQAFEQIAINEDITLRIAGDGPEKNKILKMIDRSKVKHKIDYVGYVSREDVLKNMEKSNIFVLVSSLETFGLVYLEAMSKGCITIGSLGEGVDGIIVNEENGFLSSPKNINDLVKTLEKSLSLNTNEKRKIINNAIETAKDMTQEKLSEEYLKVLQSTVSN